ncbi:heme utilization protein [Aphanothece sacrum FPU1]|uniref:Heme utilization protein n=2 Tax=Aphanothece sacrum TaxID=1122 RepID=A0A401IDT5_APHSA|nr:heme utilization protein [Aphanothece sacrum FPU1]GBF86002.1 heme utilization protein [Aphanothece sacrum FPU3]
MVGGILLTLGIGVYGGINYFVYQKLSPLVSTQLSELLQRKVSIGEVKNFSFNSIRFGISEIPTTQTDPDYLKIKEINIGFNPLPLLLGQPLKLDITVDNPNLYVAEDKTGQWIKLPEMEKGEEVELPIDIEASFKLNKADIRVHPYGIKKPLNLAINGQGGYVYKAKDDQQISYDVIANLLDSEIILKGETALNNGKTAANLQVNQLNLPQLVALIPNSPLMLKSGKFNSNVNLSLPSLEKIEGTQGSGKVDISGLVANIKPLKVPLKVNVNLDFLGQTVQFKQTEISLGNLVTQISGGVNWKEGYNLNVNVKPITIKNILKLIPSQLPINIGGEIQGNIKVNGLIKNPIVTGSINNTKSLIIDQVPIKTINANFQANLHQFILKKVEINPTVGGQIIAKGKVETGILKAIEKKQPIDWQKMPLELGLKVNLPTQKLLTPYYKSSQAVSLGNISASGIVKGTLGKPLGKFQWRSPNLLTVSNRSISGKGDLLLAGETVLLRDVTLQGEGGNITLNGVGNLAKRQWQTVIKSETFSLVPLVKVVCSFNRCPDQLLANSITLRNGDIRLTGNFDKINLETVNALANLTLIVDNGAIAINSNLSQGNLTARTFLTGISLAYYVPNLSVPVKIDNTNINFSGNIAQLFKNDTFNINPLTAEGNIKLTVAGSPVNANLQLNQGILQTVTNIGQLELNPIIPNLPLTSNLVRSNINLTGNVNSLLASLGKTPDFSSFRGDAEIQLAIENSLVNVRGNLQNGIVKGLVNLGSLSLNKIIPSLPISTQLVRGNIEASSQLNSLLSTTPNLNSIQANINLQLAAAKGIINTNTRLINNQWNSDISASRLNIATILNQIVPKAPQIDLDNLNAKMKLSGSLNSIFEETGTIPIQAKTITLNSNGQTVNANGTIIISNLNTRPDAQVNLSVDANSQLNKLPLNQLISLIPVERNLLPESVKLEGIVDFKGRFIGKQLLTNANTPGNIKLLGDVKLTNFAINNRKFENSLTGYLKAIIGEKIALNLKGSEDIIAASVIPCTRAECLFPYLPNSFELRQTTGKELPIIAQGNLQGDRFIAKIEQFPLELFKLEPTKNNGIPGFISGAVNSRIDINLFTLEGTGNIRIDNPRLGFIEANEITANLSYKDNLARLESGNLKLGRSNYDLQGYLNLKSGALQGNLNVDKGRVEDILTALKISSVDRFLDLLQLKPIDYAKAKQIPPQSVGDANSTIAEQVNLLAVIDQTIRELAAQNQAGGIPTELDIRGYFNTKVALTGTIYKPIFNLKLTGQNWQWNPQKAFPDIVEPLGLVIRDQQIIPINNIKIATRLEYGKLTIEQAQIQIKESLVGLQGNFSLQEINANWNVENLSFDTINNFFKMPPDVSGSLNSTGTVQGTIFAPKIQGQFAFVDSSFRGRSLNETIEGQFSYQNARFKLLTNEPSIVYASIDIPFPIYPGNDSFNVDVRLDTDAFTLVRIFSQDKVALVNGEAGFTLQAQGRLDLTEGFRLYEFNTDNKLILNQAVFASAAFPQPLTVTGQIDIDDKLIKVEQLQGTFADSKLTIAGVLPLFIPESKANNPLTVAIEKGEINLEGLYRGEVDGQINVTGAAIQPILGGQIQLANGQVFIPKNETETQERTVVNFNQWVKPIRQIPRNNEPIPLLPQLNNFQVSLQGLYIEQIPLFRFEFGGNLIVNGSLNNFDSLQPQGNILVSRGFVNFLETRFFIERRRLNQISFNPQQGLLNPDLDLMMRTIVSEVPSTSRELRGAETTEIPDDSLNKVQRVDINLGLKGSLAQLIPSLSKNESQVCQIQDALQPIRTSATLSDEELEKVANCLQILAAQGNGNQKLLSNPVIQLSSSPPRSQGEIVRLLGEQLFILTETLQGQSTEQLIQFGVVQLALPMVFQNVLYDIESAVSDTIGSTDFRIVPFLETIYEVEDKGFVRLSYDYGFNEFRVRYEKRF